MTLPTDIILPIHTDRILTGTPEHLEKYIRELIFTLETMYRDLSETINGEIFSDTFLSPLNWTPVLADTANPNTTFTYDHQTGWALRQGLITDCWFDVKWTANSGAITGNMSIDLPYLVAESAQKPFVGTCQPSIFAFTGGTGCVVNAIQNTYRCEVWNVGDGFTTANQGSVAAGHIIGHIRYIGQEIE